MLRHITFALTGFALVGMVSVSAQEPKPAQPDKQQAKEQQAKETLTGCVMEAKTTEGGTAYVLNNVQGGSAAMYVLTGSSPSDLATNVSKKVEVTGSVQQPKAPPNDAPANPKVLRPPIVQVESLKVIEQACK